VKKVILVLDDDELARRTLGLIFSQEGYEVLELPNVPEAINMVRTRHVDLAIVDIKMPIVDGYKFCEFLRGAKKYSHIPIIILTGEEKRYGKGEAQELAIEDFIEKPYDSHSLIRKVRQILSGSTPQTEV
jgi:DNA-binding response OmpR family regulator